MIKSLKLCTLFLGMVLVLGCSQKSGISPQEPVAALNVKSVAQALPENSPVTGNQLVRKAKSAIGTPYVYGGSAPGGFDCSGLVKWTYNSIGVNLPRTAMEQASIGRKVKDVKDMRAGDIVAFRHPKRGYHTGIYVGDGKFVHSPRKRTTVRINSLSDPYFKSTFLAARRVTLDGSENLIAQSEGRLRDYVAEKSKLTLSARNLEKIRNASRNSAAQASRKASAQASRKSNAQASRKGSVQAAGKNGKASKQVAARTAKGKTSPALQAKSDGQGKKKSTIASQASKIKSLKAVTGKKSAAKNGDAHAKLASASKKATHKSVSLLTPKNTRNAQKGRNRS